MAEFLVCLAHPFHSSFSDAGSWMLLSVVLIGLPLYALTGQYRGLARYVASSALYRLGVRNAFLVLFLVAFGVMLLLMPPRSSWFLLWLLLTGFTSGVRYVMRDKLLNLRSIQHKKQLRVADVDPGDRAMLNECPHPPGFRKVVTPLSVAGGLRT